MANGPKSRPQNGKRSHVEADVAQDSPSRPSKKRKSTHHSASRFPPPEFWDALSKVWLTPRALRELDRRNQPKGSAGARTGSAGARTLVQAQAQAQTPTRPRAGKSALQRFARHGGPELRDLRGYSTRSDTKMSSRRSHRSSHASRSSQSQQSKSTKHASSSTSKTSNTKSSGRRSSAYDADFEQHLVDNNIYPEGYEYPEDSHTPEPSDLEQIRQRLAHPRPSLSPSVFSDSAFRDFKRANARVIDEGEVMREVLPIIYGNTNIPSKQNLLFTRLESITNKTTVDAKPDFYDGAPLESIDAQVREDLGPYIIPTVHRTAPAAPNFFIEAKAPKGGADVAKRQACYDGALGARAMHELQSYSAGKPVYDNNAYTLSATYHAGNLNMYATHVTSSGPGGSSQYHMTQVDGWNTIGNPSAFRQGATALRNGRDLTMNYREQFISTANERARSMNADPSPLESSNYNGVSDTTDASPAEESQTSGEACPGPSIVTRVAAPAPLDDLTDITEESAPSAEERPLPTHTSSPPSHKRPSQGSKTAAARAPRHRSSASGQKQRSKK